MRSRPVTILMVMTVIAAALFSGGTAAARANPPALGAERTGSGSVNAQVVLYDQLTSGDQTNGWVSQRFESALHAADNLAADDFSIPAGTFFWSINKVEVDGLYTAPGYQAASVNVYFYNNAGSLPGTTTYSLSAVPSAGLDTGNFVIDLNPPVGLLAGKTYWVSVQANLDSAGGSRQWYWELRGPQAGNAAAWINPGGAFFPGTPCTTWGPLASCSGPDPGSTTDLQFRLSGSQINITATVYLPLVMR